MVQLVCRPSIVRFSKARGVVWYVPSFPVPSPPAPCRSQLCSGGADSKVIVWDITTPSLPVKVVEWLAHFGTVYALSPLAENDTGLVSGGTDTLVKVGARGSFFHSPLQ